MRVNDSSASEPMHHRLAAGLLYALGYGVVLATIGLSLWAVTQVQLMSRPETDPARYWYAAVFLICELWVAVGLSLMVRKFRAKAWVSGLLALLVWMPALGLSALQEYRYHTMLDNQIDVALAPELTRHAQATDRIRELEAQLSSMQPPTRSIIAINTELQRYRQQPNTYRTKIANLNSEVADAEAYQRLSAAIEIQRAVIAETAKTAATNSETKKLNRAVKIPGLNWELRDQAIIWILIAWMMLIKATGLNLMAKKQASLIESVTSNTEKPTSKIPQKTIRLL